MSYTDTLQRSHHSNGAGPETRTSMLRGSAQAREVTRGYLAALFPVPPPETVDTVLLVVSELVTNAFRHASRVTEFGLSTHRNLLHITVADTSPLLPHQRTPDLADDDLGETGGFGWPLVQHFAHQIDIRLGPDNTKTIRVGLPL